MVPHTRVINLKILVVYALSRLYIHQNVFAKTVAVSFEVDLAAPSKAHHSFIYLVIGTMLKNKSFLTVLFLAKIFKIVPGHMIVTGH